MEEKTMYEEVEQDENIARGCVRIKEIIAYREGQLGRMYFCQTKEQEQIFEENNPGVRTEAFSIQLLKSSAIEYLNDPENKKQFTKRS